MKKKTLAKSSRAIARLTANVDGLYAGMSQAAAEQVFENFIDLETSNIILGKYRSLALAARKLAMKKAKAFMKKRKAAKRKAK